MAAVDPEQPDPLKLGYLPTQDHSAAATARTELGLKAKATAEAPVPPAASPGSDAAALLPTRDYGPQPGSVTPQSKDAAAPAGTTTEDPAPPSLIGQRVGQYRVLRELGRGGMGVVYETLHDGISQRAALKTLHPELSRNPQFKKRFLNEARATSLAKHPGLVKVFDSGQLHDGTLYILMEFLDGESLAKRLGDDDDQGDHHQRMPEVMALRLCRQMASALSAVHAEGIAHRDLKPANVLIVKDPEAPAGERVKILDFGLAKLRADAQRIGPGDTNTSAIMGTPAYMAPEQCRSLQQADGKSDVYSLGVML
ncbi:MAG: protein kinase, partial [Deltaproteobacteria bacterium]|nr:protein kinase [Deltaproteobacteria bacterium]